MANLCNTDYKIVGDESELKQLEFILNKMKQDKTPVVANDYGVMWLGCLVHYLGGDPNKVYCRGEITSVSMEDHVLAIGQLTAWVEMAEVRHLIEQRFPKLKVYYIAEEQGCMYYATNDRNGTYFEDRCLLWHYDHTDYYPSIECAAEAVEKLVGYSVEPTKDAIEEALATSNMLPVFYREFEFVE